MEKNKIKCINVRIHTQEIRKPSSAIDANKQGETTEWERLEISSRKIRNTKITFHAKMGSLKDRDGMDQTEAEDIKIGGKNTQKNCTKKIFMTQIITRLSPR